MKNSRKSLRAHEITWIDDNDSNDCNHDDENKTNYKVYSNNNDSKKGNTNKRNNNKITG